MAHKVKVTVKQKGGLFGTKTVYKEKTVTVDNKTYKEMREAERKKKLAEADREAWEDVFFWGD